MEEEIIKKFDELYAIMSRSTDVADMKLFGKVMREAIVYITANNPKKAEELVNKLCAIKWDNYLTKEEAEKIVKEMKPSVAWSEEEVINTLTRKGYKTEEEPYYNAHALYATICMKCSDSGETIKDKILRKVSANFSEAEMLEICYWLALDSLKDKDGVFRIRKYFGLE